MSLYKYDVSESDSITEGDMVAVDARGEVVSATPREWYRSAGMPSVIIPITINGTVRNDDLMEPTVAVQPLTVGEEVTLPDGNRGTVIGTDGRSATVQVMGTIRSISVTSRTRLFHETRILRALDLARLHRVTVADLRERARVRALSDSASPLDAPSGGLCRGRYRATRSLVCDDTRVRCKGALGLYAPHPRDRAERQREPCISQRVWLSYEYPYVRWRCTTLRLTGTVTL